MTQDAFEPARILACANGASIAYVATPGAGPGVVFLHGFRSDMDGAKALHLEAWCRAQGRAFLRFDMTGHGRSSGRFVDGTIGTWLDDCQAAFDGLTEGPQIVVGSSMGGWLALLLALGRPDRVAGLVGIAAAPDFTEDLIWAQMDDAARANLDSQGVHHVPCDYGGDPVPLTRDLITDGRRHLVLRAPIDLTCPVRLVQGMRDREVPWQTAPTLAEALTGDDVRLTLIKDGEHRLSRDSDLAVITAQVAALSGA